MCIKISIEDHHFEILMIIHNLQLITIQYIGHTECKSVKNFIACKMYLEFYMGISLNQPLYFWNNFLSVNNNIYINLKFRKKNLNLINLKSFLMKLEKFLILKTRWNN